MAQINQPQKKDNVSQISNVGGLISTVGNLTGKIMPSAGASSTPTPDKAAGSASPATTQNPGTPGPQANNTYGAGNAPSGYDAATIKRYQMRNQGGGVNV